MTNPLDGGGSGFPAFKWREVGDLIRGTVISDGLDEVETPKLGTKTGETQKSVVFEIESDRELSIVNADGDTITGTQWTIWLRKPSQPFAELRNKVRAAGHKSVDRGDTVAIKFIRVEKPTQPGFNGQRIFAASFAKAVSVDALAGDDLL